jgi:hypothetical protein
MNTKVNLQVGMLEERPSFCRITPRDRRNRRNPTVKLSKSVIMEKSPEDIPIKKEKVDEPVISRT